MPANRPIVWDVVLDARPPYYEILFLDQVNGDHRLAKVPFVQAPPADIDRTAALVRANGEMEQLSLERRVEALKGAEVIDRRRVRRDSPASNSGERPAFKVR